MVASSRAALHSLSIVSHPHRLPHRRPPRPHHHTAGTLPHCLPCRHPPRPRRRRHATATPLPRGRCPVIVPPCSRCFPARHTVTALGRRPHSPAPLWHSPIGMLSCHPALDIRCVAFLPLCRCGRVTAPPCTIAPLKPTATRRLGPVTRPRPPPRPTLTFVGNGFCLFRYF